MTLLEQFGNLENAAAGGVTRRPRIMGYAASGRAYRVAIAPRAKASERWVVRVMTPKEVTVPVFRAASLVEVSNKLREL